MASDKDPDFELVQSNLINLQQKKQQPNIMDQVNTNLISQNSFWIVTSRKQLVVPKLWDSTINLIFLKDCNQEFCLFAYCHFH